MADKKKQGMMGKALQGMNARTMAAGGTPIKAKPKPKPKAKTPVNKNKRGTTPTTSAAKAKAQKEAIMKRIDQRVQASKAK